MPSPNDPTAPPPTVDHLVPATDAPETVVPTGVAPPIELPFPPTIAGYVIEGRLGKGGMGVVYKARQPGLDRVVALKMILNADHDERRRFLHEAKALAELRHPNIVQVYEVGEHEGNPFISLEYIDGGSLDAHLAGTPLPPRDAAILVEKLARGMQAAHDAGIIHRDLKPPNVLLQSTPGEPSPVRGRVTDDAAPPGPLRGTARQEFIPKITDFGLARRIAEPGQTQSGAILGTPSYMAPEQAGGKVKELDARADVYALGAILYECLTGRPPFRAATVMDTLMQVLSEEPVAPSQLNRDVPRDLETVCLKCLQKEPGKRFQAACGLADDLGRYLRGEPVQARPVGRIERAWRWCKCNPALAAALTAAMFLLLAGTTLATVLALLERSARMDEMSARRLANERLEIAKHNLLTAQLLRVEAIYEQHPQKALELLHDTASCPIILRDEAWHFFDNYCQRGRLLGHIHPVASVSFSPDGKTLASGSFDSKVRLWQLAGERMLPEFQGLPDRWGTVMLWDVASGKMRAILQGHAAEIHCVLFSPDGKTLASGSNDNTVKLWDVAKGQERATLHGHTRKVTCVSFSPDGKTLASGSDDRTVKLWDVATAQARTTLQGHIGEVVCVSFSPDSATLASGSRDDTVKLWDIVTGQPRTTLQRHINDLTCVSFSPDGKTLATAGGRALLNPGVVRLWDVATGQVRSTFKGHASEVDSVSFSPDGRTLASGSRDKTVMLWDVSTGLAKTTLWGHIGHVTCISFSPDGKTLASGSDDRTVKLWDMATEQAWAMLHGHSDEVTCISFSPNGRILASGGRDKRVVLWDVATGEVNVRLQALGEVYCLSFSPDGKTLASGSSDETVKLWDVAKGRSRATLHGHTTAVTSVSFSPDGKTLASGSWETLKLWDVATGQARATLRGHTNGVTSVSFSPDGKTLASGSFDRSVILWDVATGQARSTLQGHTRGVNCVSFSPDGKTLASGSADATVKLWNLDTGLVQATLPGYTGEVSCVSFSPDGKTLASSSVADHFLKLGEVRLWHVATGQARATLQYKDALTSISFSPDGTTLASGSLDNSLKLWDMAAGRTRVVLQGDTTEVYGVSYSQDGARLISRGSEHKTLMWDVENGTRVDELPPGTAVPGQVSPDGEIEAAFQGKLIHLVDRRWKPPALPPLFQPDPHWHGEQLALAEKENHPFAAAFHQSRLAGFEPWDATHRLKEAEAWSKAAQPERAARAFLQAVLLDPRVGERQR